MGKQSTGTPIRFAGVVGTARRKGDAGNRGRPVVGEVRPLMPGNAGGGKDPDFWCAFEEGEDAVIGDEPCNTRKIRTLQRKLYCKAKAEPAFRFYLLYDKICREDIVRHAYALTRTNAGAPGVDGVTFAQIETDGRERWLSGLREELVSKTYRPAPVRRVTIPKPGGGERPLGIPTIRDRVVQTAAKLVLEPIFEADFEESAYGYRPGRSAGDAIKAVHRLVCRATRTWSMRI